MLVLLSNLKKINSIPNSDFTEMDISKHSNNISTLLNEREKMEKKNKKKILNWTSHINYASSI